MDLGSRCTFDRIALSWIRPAAEGAIQVSDDAIRPGRRFRSSGGDPSDVKLGSPAQGRYVRVVMTKPARAGWVHSQRTGSVRDVADSLRNRIRAPAPSTDGSLHLAGGGWRVQRESQVSAERRGAFAARVQRLRLGCRDGSRLQRYRAIGMRARFPIRTSAITSS